LDDRIDIFANGNIDARDTMTIISNGNEEQTMESPRTESNDQEVGLVDRNQSATAGYMSVEKVKERIVQWFISEAGGTDDEQEMAGFVASQF